MMRIGAFPEDERGISGIVRSLIAISLFLSADAGAGSLLDFTYGKLKEARGETSEAVEFFEKAYAADPSAMPLVRLIAESRLAAGDRTGALDAYQKVIAARNDDPGVSIEYGDFLGRVGRGDALADNLRKKAYQNSLKAMPGTYVATERMIRFLREKGEDEEARGLLETLGTESPEAVLYYVSTTKSLYDSEDKEAGERVDRRFEEALMDHPEWAGIARKASDHFRESGRGGRAIDVLRMHLESSPSSLDLKIRLGILMFSEKRLDEGVEILNEVLEVHPGKALAHESLAKHYRNEGDGEKARFHAAELLKIQGGGSEDFVKLAEEMEQGGDVRGARLLLEKAAFNHPQDGEVLMKLAILTSKDPETKEMASRLFKEAEAAISASGEATDPAFSIGFAKELIARGENAAAEERLRNAIRNFPKDAKAETAEAMRELAALWISEGRNLDAAEALMARADSLER